MQRFKIDPEKFKYIKQISWNDIFSIWRENEESRENWIRHYKNKGFNSWQEWRTTEIVKPLGLNEKEWTLYKIRDPLKTIPNFRGGPFKSWIERFYEGRPNPTFAKLAEQPDIQKHSGINEIMQNFPEKSLLISLATPKGIIILEGMHRCCALSLAAERHIAIHTNIDIALAKCELTQ